MKVGTYCRDAILARAMPEPDIHDVATLPAWLLHFLQLPAHCFRQGNRNVYYFTLDLATLRC